MRSLILRGAARPVLPLLGLSCLIAAACTESVGSGPEATASASAAITKGVPGDMTGDKRGDIALTGGPGWGSVPVAASNGDGTFTVYNNAISEFATYATQGASAVSGDFNGDGLADVALTGGFIPGSDAPWGSIPVAFSNGNGTFHVTNYAVSGFPTYATQTSLSPVAGDFDNNHCDDIALAGGPDWGTIPVAFSNCDGTFHVTNLANVEFEVFAQQGARLLAGDFDGDHFTDLALTGGTIPATGSGPRSPWGSLPVAFSNGDGTFRVVNSAIANFGTYATQNALAVTGDFDGDGRADVALTGGFIPDSGGAPWGSIPVAFSNGNGTFHVVNSGAGGNPTFAAYAVQGPVQVVSADFNDDGLSDLALTSGLIPGTNNPWGSIPVAFSNGNGTFRVTNDAVSGFPTYATQSAYPNSPTAVSASEARWPLQQMIIP